MSSPLDHSKLDFPCQSQPQIEVAGAIDAFVNLEEIAPDADWSEVLADTWGVPSLGEQPQESGLPALLKKLNLPWFR